MSDAVAVMTGLVEFYRARLDEDEAVALPPSSVRGVTWSLVVEPGEGGWTDQQIADFAVHFDPLRALCQVAAHRKILDQYENWCRLYEERTSHDMARASMGQVLDELERVVLALVQVYAEHPEFRQEWKVG